MTSRLNGARWAALAAIVAASAALVPGAASADETAAATSGITLEVVSVNGSGCPGGADVKADRDGTGFRIKYSNFRVDAPATSAATNPTTRKNCQLGVEVSYPSGVTFAIASADYWGKVQLGASQKAKVGWNYYQQADTNNKRVERVINGPTSGTWATTHVADELFWTPCGGSSEIININTELIVAGKGKGNFISLSGSDADVNTLVNLEWRDC
jgi:Domain of unknown function (DUF4360)